MATTPRGVRSISERLLKEGRALIITSEDYNNYDFASLPDGALHVDVNSGVVSVKLKGETTWQPTRIITTADNAKVENPTLVISRDSQYNEEIFKITEVNKAGESFAYVDSKDMKKHSRCKIEEDYFVFELQNGTYFKGRNHLEVWVDGVLYRTAENGGIEEISDIKFALLDSLEPGQTVTVRYVKWARIGNPYPRIFIGKDDPCSKDWITSYKDEDKMEYNAQLGDIWIDTDDDMLSIFEGL